MPNIPASDIVRVIPGVLSAGGNALDLNGLMLTENPRVPVGSVLSFASQADVADFFGPTSTEAGAATNYFLGFDNSTKKPGALLFSQYPSGPVAGWLRGGDISSLTLAQLQALTGTLIVTVDGVTKTSSAIDLAAATSFSNAATIILAAFTTPGFTLAFDPLAGAYQLTSSTTGATSSLSFATGTLAAPLLLTQQTGAILSPGAVAGVPLTNMAAVVAQTQNWAGFTTLFDPDGGSGSDQKLAFAAWVNGTGNRFWYVPWDTDVTPTSSNSATTSLGYLIGLSEYSGITPIWVPSANAGIAKASAALAYMSSIDFSATQGRATMKFRSQQGLTPDVTNQTVATNLIANGYTFYGTWATADDQFNFFADGNVSGQFQWADSYLNQIWLNNALQLAGMSGITQAKSVPYNQDGYSTVYNWFLDPILAAVNFGAIQPGVELSNAQRVYINTAAGMNVDRAMFNQGWYLQIKGPTPQVRQARGTPVCNFFYMDGQSIQKIDLSSVLVQ